ncbi:MAG: hypothetical protein HKP61_01365, partial [Dactylosporangium sp.]|nr:hypothetical protein [Dactylosporangium sp.]NNJ59614.1 hypothetical protein [Dactylosporangium sp.]
RRRHRSGQPAGFVLGVLIAAVALSLSAQVVEAERSIVGWLAAALPALGFLALVKIILSRTPTSHTTETDRTTPVPPETTRTSGTNTVPVTVPETGPARTTPVPTQLTSQDDTDDTDGGDETAGLLDQARALAAAHLAEHGRPITRDQLRAGLRTGTNTATVLHRQVRQDGRPGLVPVPNGTFTRANGTTPVGPEVTR